MVMPSPRALLARLETREALLVAFFAAFIVLARAAMRWHLNIPGHAMLPTALLLVLARGCVPRTGAATAAGLLAGLASAALGMGKAGPMMIVKLTLPGLVVDGGAVLLRPLPEAVRWSLVGALAGAADFLPSAALERLSGAPWDLVAQHAAVSAGGKAAFGALGGWAGAAILRRLRQHGVIG
jgi:hypothetical protein